MWKLRNKMERAAIAIAFLAGDLDIGEIATMLQCPIDDATTTIHSWIADGTGEAIAIRDARLVPYAGKQRLYEEAQALQIRLRSRVAGKDARTREGKRIWRIADRASTRTIRRTFDLERAIAHAEGRVWEYDRKA